MTSPTPTPVLGRFRYRAVTELGEIRRGTLLARSAESARDELAALGLSVLRVEPLPRLLPARPVKLQELAVVFRNVATLVSAGVPVEAALAASEDLVRKELSAILAEVRRLIREGASVGGALEALPGAFPPSVIGLIRAGERSSSMASACTLAAEQLEAAAELGSSLRSALAYPALILMVGLVTVAVMILVVIPRFADVLAGFGTELPAATGALLTAGTAVKSLAPVLAPATVVGLPLAWMWLRTPAARSRMDRWLLDVPLIGRIRHAFASARTCTALGGMLEGGMPLLAALDAATEAAGDHEVAVRLRRAREAVARGDTLTRAITDERALHPTAIQLVGVGESSGELGAMARSAGEVTGKQATRLLRTAVSLLEPLLVVLLGVLVAAVSAALLQAVYSIRPA